MKPLIRFLPIACVCLLVSCTNSEWLLSALYNRMDNILATETKEYADFTAEQSEQIDLLADQYHQWHRQNHLPQYAALLRDIDAYIQPGGSISYAQVESWSDQIEGFAREMADCYPLNSAFDLMRSLSDEQVEQVLVHGIEEYEDFVEERSDRTEEDRIDRRYKETRKWLGRVELDLQSEQLDHLRETIVAEKRLGGAGMELWKTWHEQFVEILKARNSDQFETEVGRHIQKLWTLQDDNFPEVVAYNRQLWIDYFYDLSQSQTEAQRQKFSKWLGKMADNLDGIATNIDPDNQLPQLAGQGSCNAPDQDFAGYSEKTSSPESLQDQDTFESQNM